MHAVPQAIAFSSGSPGGRGLARLGDAMRRHRRIIMAVQWAVVSFYAVLVLVPPFLDLPRSGATILSDLTLFAQFAFWGLWWPFVMLSTMLLGRVWCGVFCPEGALCELASRHGLGRSIPRWLRWGGWPLVAFVSVTVYGQLISVYEYPKAALVILGGSTVASVGVGLVYGKGKRVWCRYLCPASGVFALLARIAPVHFRADEAAWKRFALRPARVDCAPLVDMRRLKSASQCHACGRCSGYRDAIVLAARSPNREILHLKPGEASASSALLLVFGVLGIALGAFQWTVSPWFVQLKQRAAEWLVARDSFWLLEQNAPWWILTHYPEASDVFSWLDGLSILAYLFGIAATIGGITLLALLAAERLAGGTRFDWKTLAMALVPLAGIGAFLGLSMLTLAQLRAEGVTFGWVSGARGALLALGLAWSAWLGARIVLDSDQRFTRRALALAVFALPLAAIGGAWVLTFYVW